MLDSKLITEAQLDQVLELQQSGDKRRLGTILIDEEWLNAESLAMALSIHLNLPFADLSRESVPPAVLKIIPEHIARRYQLIPVEVNNGSLNVVMEDPTDIRVLEEISALTGMNINPSVGVGMDIEEAIDHYYKANQEIEREVAEFSGAVDTSDFDMDAGVDIEDPVVRAVDMILEQAVRDRASDIHIVPDHTAVRVRFRVDGMLRDALSLPRGSHYQLLSRIKVLADMNIAERRRPQDGQFSVQIGEEETFFRVATSDTTMGEIASIRILGRTESIINMKKLGMQNETLQQIQRLIKSPFGMILVAGPTGSGKTTTLYAALNQLDRQRYNIMTIEDPVEFNFKGISQVQVNRAADITFASGLRGLMRLDPDKIMVGEIRDEETAKSAVQSALTGHMVLSSIHANNAAGTFFRLIHLGVDHYLINSSVLGMISQRLLRLTCTHCSIEITEINPLEAEVYQKVMGEPLEKYTGGEGCTYCQNTGYQGRIGVFELLVVNDEIRQMFTQGASSNEIENAAIENGMLSMLQDGMMKVKQGVTTPAEVMRNVYSIE
ncbi:MAG: GspE/PulE family protein [Anaerolineales bacterium]|nr:GspE/PulE family protein [Anaerolineales bacterium]MDZ7844610.1 GspE/PulE family protein [Anaerolineales bacterium]